MLKSFSAVALIAASALTTAGGQGRDMRDAKPIRSHVHVATVALAGDTMILGYRAVVLTAGDESLWGVLVDNPARIAYLRAPAGQQWVLHTNYRERPAALWMNDGPSLTKPGDSTGVLVVASRGLPRLVWYWGIPDLVAHPAVETDETDDPYRTYGDSGLTVGVEPAPRLQNAELLGRLADFLRRACGDLAWINSPGVCNSLEVKLDAAGRALQSGRSTAAAGELDAFVAELKAQSGASQGNHVSLNAWALLWPNAQYLATRLR